MRIRNVLSSLAAPAAAMGALIAYGFVVVAVKAVPIAIVGSCAAYSGLPSGNHDTAGMTFIQAGTFTMGSESHQPEERFIHVARVDGFWIDRHEVTNAQFKQFVDATGYTTLAERVLDAKANPGLPEELLAPGSMVFAQPSGVRGNEISKRWHYISGANWRQPNGPGSSLAGKENHPVVHVAYDDALAYAQWRGHSLPTEAQWEFAARGGRDGEDDWSSAFDADGKPTANTWQGIFPVLNTQDDGGRRS
jgi:sulfatase modifying factor 1